MAGARSGAGAYRLGTRFGPALSKVTIPIFIAIIFFVVMTLVGLVARGFGHRPLRAEGDRRNDLQRQF